LNTAVDALLSADLLSDPRLERLLTIGKETNDLRVKIKAATGYLARESKADDLEAVEVARNQLARDLSRELAEAKALMPALDEIVYNLQEQERNLENVRKMNVGLARIEGLSGTGRKKGFLDAADSAKAKIESIENLIGSFDSLQEDLSSPRRAPHVCPRCSSVRVSYRITPSDLGYTLYRCDDCTNAWRIMVFSIHAT
jgi:DNA-directed RNA polymerase subunit M/transcription elongation factor TFIIS